MTTNEILIRSMVSLVIIALMTVGYGVVLILAGHPGIGVVLFGVAFALSLTAGIIRTKLP